MSVPRGLDGSHEILVARSILDLNPLVVSYDSGSHAPETLAKLEKPCKKLRVDLREVRCEGAYDHKFIRCMARAPRNSGIHWDIGRFCGCAVSGSMQKVAREDGISTMLVSHNPYKARL